MNEPLLKAFLSYRDLEEMMAERGLTVDHVTIWRCVSASAGIDRLARSWEFWRRRGWKGASAGGQIHFLNPAPHRQHLAPGKTIMFELEALYRVQVELRLRAEVEEAKRRLRLATPEEQPKACRRLTDALHVFANLLLEPRATELKMRHGVRPGTRPAKRASGV